MLAAHPGQAAAPRARPTATASTPGSPQVRADPRELPGEFAALGVAAADWTLRDTRADRHLPRPHGALRRRRRARQRARAAGDRRRARFDRLLPLRTPGRDRHGAARARACSRRSRGARAARSARAYARSQRFVRGPEAAQPAGAAAAARASRRRDLLPARRLVHVGASRARKSPARARGPGSAYLFNGPQLGYSIPELFVEFELHSPAQNVRGVSAAGRPGGGHRPQRPRGLGLHLRPLRRGRPLRRAAHRRRRPTASGAPTRQMECRDETLQLPRARHRPARPRSLQPEHACRARRTERICRTVHGPVAGARRRRAPTRAATRSGAASSRRSSGLTRAQRRERRPRRRRARCSR